MVATVKSFEDPLSGHGHIGFQDRKIELVEGRPKLDPHVDVLVEPCTRARDFDIGLRHENEAAGVKRHRQLILELAAGRGVGCDAEYDAGVSVAEVARPASRRIGRAQARFDPAAERQGTRSPCSSMLEASRRAGSLRRRSFHRVKAEAATMSQRPWGVKVQPVLRSGAVQSSLSVVRLSTQQAGS